ncbi:MAG: YfdX family protein [Candidatus Omnitrophica bacterium]|nr:YfdX family protein [Candidatus Omnitrophota bacterium]
MNIKKIFGIFFTLIFLCSFAFCGGLNAQSNDPNDQEMCVTQNDLKTSVQNQQKETQKTEDKKLIQEALNAYDQTLKAVGFLDKGNKDKAFEALEQAVGKLDILTARFPQLAYLPINMNVGTLSLNENLDAIKQHRAEVESLIKNGYLQAARRILDNLVSEIRITSVNLPMSTYPTAIRGAASLIQENKIAEAQKSLQVTLSTLVILENSIPIPILNSQSYLQGASKIVSSITPDKLTQDKKDQVQALLKKANDQLEIAEELGYGKHDVEFAQLYKDIQEIKNKITNNQESSSFLDKLKIRLEDFKNRISK